MNSHKYIEQTNEYNCGPVAIHNVMVWAEYWNSKYSFRNLNKMCQTEPTLGSLYNPFNKTLRQVCRDANLNINLTWRPSYYQIRKYLESGSIVVLLFHWEEYNDKGGEHYAIIVDYNDDGVYIVNHDQPDSNVVDFIPNRRLKLYLRHYEYVDGEKYTDYDDCIGPKAWVINKILFQ